MDMLQSKTSSKRIIHSNLLSADSFNFGDGERFVFTRDSFAVIALIISLFRLRFIGRLMTFSGGKINIIHFFATSAFIFIPLLYMFLFIGHYSKLGCIVIGRIVPVTHGVAYTMISIAIIQAIFEVMVASDALHYFRESFSSSLPWMTCQQEWGSNCTGIKEMNLCGLEHKKVFMETSQFSAFQYRTYVLKTMDPSQDTSTSHINVVPQRILYLFIACVLLMLISDLDLSSNNKIVNLVFIFISVTMIGLALVISVHLKNTAGVFSIFVIKTESLLNYTSWVDAVLYFVKTISVASPCTVLIGSYFPPTAMTDLKAFVVWIGLMSLYSIGELIASTVRSVLASKMCVLPEDFENHHIDEDIVFAVIPQFLGSISLSPQTFCCIYFIMVFVSSVIRVKLLLASVYYTLADAKPVIRLYCFYIRIFSCCLLFIAAFPICIVSLLHGYVKLLIHLEDWLAISVLVVITIGVLYVYGTQTLCDDHHFIYGSQPAVFFKVTLVVVPVCLFAVAAILFLRMSDLNYSDPQLAHYLYGAFFICLSLHFAGFLYITIYYLKRQNMAHLLKCEDTWGDPSSKMRKERIIYHPRKETNYFRRIDVCNHECLRYCKLNPIICKDEDIVQNEGFRSLTAEQKLFSDKEVGL